jgi:hypothetical protein
VLKETLPIRDHKTANEISVARLESLGEYYCPKILQFRARGLKKKKQKNTTAKDTRNRSGRKKKAETWPSFMVYVSSYDRFKKLLNLRLGGAVIARDIGVPSDAANWPLALDRGCFK